MPPPDPSTETREELPDLSISEHEAQFQRVSERHTTTEPEPSPPATDNADSEPRRDTPPRDGSGRFQPRTRARSHQAGREDVPRIAELTKRLRAAEAERDEWKTKATPPAERPPDVSHPDVDGEVGDRRPAEGARAEPPAREAVRPAAALVKPLPTDTKADGTAKYATYEEYLDARDEYLRDTWRQEQAQTAEAARVTADWKARTDAAKSKYDDFESVALLKPTKIPAGSLVDAFILEDEGGADVLYHFQKDEADLDRVLAMSPFKAVKYLSLLSQRLHDDEPAEPRRTPAAAGETAAPRQPVNRPPTPVRTVPTRPPEEPPGDEASLAEHERVYGQRQRRH